MRKLIFIVLSLITLMSQAQPVIKRQFTLTGTVTDVSTGERIPFASLLIKDTTIGTITDVNGYFILEKIPADTVTVVVKYLGYQSKEIRLTPSQENPPLSIQLKEQAIGLDEVLIVAHRDDKAMQISNSEHLIKMSPAALKVLPNVGENPC